MLDCLIETERQRSRDLIKMIQGIYDVVGSQCEDKRPTILLETGGEVWRGANLTRILRDLVRSEPVDSVVDKHWALERIRTDSNKHVSALYPQTRWERRSLAALFHKAMNQLQKLGEVEVVPGKGTIPNRYRRLPEQSV